jgi:cation-transporting ATPase E
VPPVSSTDPAHGLSEVEAAARAAGGLANRPPRPGGAAYRAIAARNLLTPFNALVVPAAVALLLLGDLRGAWAVGAMAAVNAAIGLAQEVRAKRHLDRLDLLAETRARVVRDGAERLLPAGDVVEGDLIRLVAGDAVVADGPVLAAEFLEIDEALLTGESDPVARRPGDRLLSGSFAVAGVGSYRADGVGAGALAHQTSAAARQYRHAPGPVQQGLDKLVRALTVTTIALCAAYVGLYFGRGLPAAVLAQMVAATVTSVVPQGLILMTTLALTLGAVRLAARGAVVQRLAAVEAMASVDVLCADKTGTVTTSDLAVDRVEAFAGREADVRALLGLFAWATIDAGNRTVQALRAALPMPTAPFAATDQVPFKSQTRTSAVTVRTAGGEQTLVLGSSDAFLLRFSAGDAGRVEARFRDLLPSGLRLLAFASADDVTADAPLYPLALVAFRDDLRPGVEAVLGSLAAQGVALKLLSGDHPETVWATVSRLDLPLARGPVRTGVDLEAVADRAALIAATSVFGRVTPRQKLDIVTTLQAQGRRVAMVGDGVNDVLAIKAADLGVAMGAGSAAAKAVAGLVIETNDFGLLPVALAEGRAVLHNVRRAAKLFLLKVVYTLVLVVGLVGVLGEAFPYLPQQVTLLNALTIGGPVLLVMLSTAPPGAAARAAFLPEVGRFVLGMGLPVGVAGLAVWHVGGGVEEKRTVLLSTLVLAGLANAVLVGGGEWRFVAWAALAGLVYLAAMAFGPTADFFALTALPARQWAAAAAAAAAGVTAGRLLTRREREVEH